MFKEIIARITRINNITLGLLLSLSLTWITHQASWVFFVYLTGWLLGDVLIVAAKHAHDWATRK